MGETFRRWRGRPARERVADALSVLALATNVALDACGALTGVALMMGIMALGGKGSRSHRPG